MSRLLVPDTAGQTCQYLVEHEGACILAGGTDLLTRMNSGAPTPTAFIDIKRIAAATTIQREGDDWVVGAAVSASVLGNHAELKKHWPGVVEAANLIGSTQIQSRATLGGNLCNASPAADSVPALSAADAKCRIAGPDGEREATIGDIVTGPGQTSLGRAEFIVSFRLPGRAPRSADAYLRMIPRTEMDIAVAGAAVSLTLDDNDLITDIRVALGAVGPRPMLADAAASLLKGLRPDDSVLPAFRQAVQNLCRPISDKRATADYRSHVAGVLAGRAAVNAWQRARKT